MLAAKVELRVQSKGWVHCPICTHTVEAWVLTEKKRSWSKPGQRCARCNAPLDAACVLRLDRAA